ncbi:hypothetical protein BKA62DRAFT_682191 [Auriculariales sp. MPI-PUGE-AT-0066]|nr:hypothetical protein BKA62DRAFT_682191 [Auriculariales sp. MPI-PUGE-AT-0066]
MHRLPPLVGSLGAIFVHTSIAFILQTFHQCPLNLASLAKNQPAFCDIRCYLPPCRQRFLPRVHLSKHFPAR